MKDNGFSFKRFLPLALIAVGVPVLLWLSSFLFAS
jgi:hypothetical protein